MHIACYTLNGYNKLQFMILNSIYLHYSLAIPLAIPLALLLPPLFFLSSLKTKSIDVNSFYFIPLVSLEFFSLSMILFKFRN